jgi:hypothetical protein
MQVKDMKKFLETVDDEAWLYIDTGNNMLRTMSCIHKDVIENDMDDKKFPAVVVRTTDCGCRGCGEYIQLDKEGFCKDCVEQGDKEHILSVTGG